MAKFQTLVQNLPELVHISLCRACHIHQIDGYHALIETAVELMASILIPLGILHRQEGAASHAWIYIALLQLFHDFCGYIIRDHAFCRTFCGKLRQVPIFRILCNIIFI